MWQIEIPRKVESLNVWQRWHWRRRGRERDAWVYEIKSAIKCQKPKKYFKYVKIISYRRRLLDDDDNLIGGAKPLRDAIALCGLIKTDADKDCKFIYEQKKDKRYFTRIELT